MLPQDPVMLYSFLNMKLRDQYSNLSDLCDGLDIGEGDLLIKMSEAGYIYDRETNRFIQK